MLQETAGHMLPQVALSSSGKNRPEAHSCTSLLTCQPKQLSILSLQMASGVAGVKRELESECSECGSCSWLTNWNASSEHTLFNVHTLIHIHLWVFRTLLANARSSTGVPTYNSSVILARIHGCFETVYLSCLHVTPKFVSMSDLRTVTIWLQSFYTLQHSTGTGDQSSMCMPWLGVMLRCLTNSLVYTDDIKTSR